MKKIKRMRIEGKEILRMIKGRKNKKKGQEMCWNQLKKTKQNGKKNSRRREIT